MDNTERKQVVAQLLKEGRNPSEIQEYLRKEKNDSITYMELRLLLSEMQARLPDAPSKQVTPLKASPITAATVPPAPAPPRGKGQPAAAPAQKPTAGPRGKTTVMLDEAPPPGAMVSGRVHFGSGAKAYWVLDETGRIGLDPELGSGRPDQQDMTEFQNELRRLLEQAQGGVA
jgi:hypothetical protein